MEIDDSQGFGLDVVLTGTLPGRNPAIARDLTDEAHVVCPFSQLADVRPV